MFTGIVEELGHVRSFNDGTLRIGAETVLEDAGIGDSIAVNGCCLTVTAMGRDDAGGWWEADVSHETLRRTNLGDCEPGAVVNLERPVRAQDRLGGHIVQGHVDGRGRLVSIDTDGEFRVMRFWFPEELARYFIEKGSVAVDGISLTIAALGSETFDVALIPKTWEMTNLATLGPGDEVNLEVDMIAKYVERIIMARG